jgi:hypothetical protein
MIKKLRNKVFKYYFVRVNSVLVSKKDDGWIDRNTIYIVTAKDKNGIYLNGNLVSAHITKDIFIRIKF